MSYGLLIDELKNTKCGKICSETPVDIFVSFRGSTISRIKDGIESRRQNSSTITVIGYVALTAIGCVAIAFCPKIIALGCVTVLTFAYKRLARKADSSEKRLLDTMCFYKDVEGLSTPRLSKAVFRFLEKKVDDIASVDVWGGSLSATLYMSKGYEELHQGCKELHKEYKELHKEYEELREKVTNLRQAEVNLKEDLIPLRINFTDCIRRLQSIKQSLNGIKRNLDGDSKQSLERDFSLTLEKLISSALEALTKKLTNVEDLPEMLENFQLNRSFFKDNGDLFHKTQNIFLETDLKLLDQMSACRNFMFYSLTGIAMISFGPSYRIMVFGGGLVMCAVKNALQLIAYRNDEAKKQDLLATITKEEKSILDC